MPQTFFLYLFYVNENAQNVVFVVKGYAVRKAKIRPFAVHRLKMKGVGGGGGSPSCILVL